MQTYNLMPDTTTLTASRLILTDRTDSLRSSFSGSTAPATAVLGQLYVDSDDNIPYICTNATGPVFSTLRSCIGISSYGATLVDDADAATARSTLGLGTMSTQAASAVAITGGTAKLNNTGLSLIDVGGSFALTIAPGSTLTANRTLTITTGDAARTLDISAASVTISSFMATVTDDTSASAARTTLGAAASGANTDLTSVTLNNTGLVVKDVGGSFSVILKPGSTVTAQRTVTLTTGDSNRTLDISAADVTISSFMATVTDDTSASAARTTLGAAASGANTDITAVTLNQTGLVVKGATSTALTIKPNETYTSGRTLNLVLNDADRTLTIGASTTLSGGTHSGTNTGDQTITLTGEVTGTGTGSFAATLDKTAITNRTQDTNPVANADYVVTYDASATALKKVLIKDLKPIMAIIIAIGDETTAITTGTAKVTFRMPFAFTLTDVRANVNTVSSSGLPTVNIKESGTTIFTTKVTIDASEKTSTTAATAMVLSDTSLADDAEITFDIDVAGTGAKGLKIALIGYRT